MQERKPVIILLGPQGSGKGTQGKRLAQKLGIPYVEAGKLLRDEISSKSPRGKYISSVIDAGTLLPDDFISEFMADKITQAVEQYQGVLADGFPRRIRQAEAFDKIAKPTHVLLIDIPDEESVSRLLLRAQKENRVDDTREKILYRLRQYHSDTEPLVDRYERQGVLRRIDGTPSIDDVEKSVWEVFS